MTNADYTSGEVLYHPGKGQHIGEAVEVAVWVSRRVGRKIVLVFNDTPIDVKPEDYPSDVLARYYKREIDER